MYRKVGFIVKDVKGLNVINDENLEEVNAGLVSKGALAGIIAGSLAGAALLATAIGVPLARKIKKDKAGKAKADAAEPATPAASANSTTPATIPFEVENQENIFPETVVYGVVEGCSFDDLMDDD